MWQVGAQAERYGYSKLRCPEEESSLASSTSSQQFSASILSQGVGIGASRERV